MFPGYTTYEDEYYPFNGHYYLFFSDEGRNWEESRKLCQQNYADLAIYGMQDWNTRR